MLIVHECLSFKSPCCVFIYLFVYFFLFPESLCTDVSVFYKRKYSASVLWHCLFYFLTWFLFAVSVFSESINKC